MAIDYEALAKGMAAAVPFNGHLGLEYVSIGPGEAVIRLPDDERLRNHVGSQHAGGLFAVAEAASGGAFVSCFAERLGDVTPLAAEASIRYTKLAKGPIDATGRLDGAEELIAELDREGKVSFPIEVELADSEGNAVANATVQWHVRLKS